MKRFAGRAIAGLSAVLLAVSSLNLTVRAEELPQDEFEEFVEFHSEYEELVNSDEEYVKPEDLMEDDLNPEDVQEKDSDDDYIVLEDIQIEDADLIEFLVEDGELLEFELEASDMAANGQVIDEMDLIEGYFYYDQPAGATIYSKGYNGNKLSGANRVIYDTVRAQAARIAAGEESNASVSIDISSSGVAGQLWTASELGISGQAVYYDSSRNGYIISNEASQAVFKKAGVDPVGVWRIVLRDCPYEMYWANLKMNYSGVTGTYSNGEWRVGLSKNIKINLDVSYEFSAGQYIVDVNKTRAVAGAKANALNIVNECAGLSDIDKIRTYVNKICALNSYNYDALNLPAEKYGNPWQMIYVFDGNPSTNVVCEGYSKSFQFLMDNSRFTYAGTYSYIVTGYMNGGLHMWNIIHMPDGKNYLMDLTGCDSGDSGRGMDYFFFGTPSGGNVSSVYYFNFGRDIPYEYDANTRAMYSTAELTISTTKYAGIKPVDKAKAQAFVKRLYTDCLGRSYDTDGLNAWTNQLCSRNIDGATIGAGFVFSKEYIAKGTTKSEYIKMLYKVFMGREADAAGLAYWKNQMRYGKTREEVFKAFIDSEEYTKICEKSGISKGTYTIKGLPPTVVRDMPVKKTTKQYVERIYSKALNRASDPSGIDYWCKQISNEEWDPVDVAEFFILSSEFEAKKLNNTEYIKVLYRTFMGREADSAGLKFWIGELNKGQTRKQVLERFAGCAEFQNIVKSFGL